jgi:phosphatidylserine decarboxylase
MIESVRFKTYDGVELVANLYLPDQREGWSPGIIVCHGFGSADGKVMHAGPARPDEAPAGTWQQVTIFLSVLDVHINRTPVAGRVTRVAYVPGSFLAAFNPDAHRNEHTEIWLEHRGLSIVVRQVVGLLARRVVCRIAPGDQLDAGQRIGLMKFGSRMDVFMPESTDVTVKAGDRVRAAQTVIGRLPTGAAS